MRVLTDVTWLHRPSVRMAQKLGFGIQANDVPAGELAMPTYVVNRGGGSTTGQGISSGEQNAGFLDTRREGADQSPRLVRVHRRRTQGQCPGTGIQCPRDRGDGGNVDALLLTGIPDDTSRPCERVEVVRDSPARYVVHHDGGGSRGSEFAYLGVRPAIHVSDQNSPAVPAERPVDVSRCHDDGLTALGGTAGGDGTVDPDRGNLWLVVSRRDRRPLPGEQAVRAGLDVYYFEYRPPGQDEAGVEARRTPVRGGGTAACAGTGSHFKVRSVQEFRVEGGTQSLVAVRVNL